jgi:predicted lipid-binding transport protein (Tim44 family)
VTRPGVPGAESTAHPAVTAPRVATRTSPPDSRFLDAAVARWRARAAYPYGMGRTVLKLLGVVLAIWLAFMAIGGILAMVKTFLIVGVIAVVVFLLVSLVAKRPGRG